MSRVLICFSMFVSSRLIAGDAVAIGYNGDGIWTDVTYFRSATSKGGKDYRTSDQAREFALRDVRRRSQPPSPRRTFFHFPIQPGLSPSPAARINLPETFTALVAENRKPRRTKKHSTC